MAGNGNLTAARIYSLADVYVATSETAAPTDTTTPLGGDWDLVGLIDDDGGIGQEFSSDDTDHYAYGSIFIRKTSVKEKLSMTLTALENSDLVWLLANPGSETATDGGTTTRIRRPRNLADAIRAVVLELVDGDVTTRLYIPRAQITQAGTRTISDNEIAGFPLTLDVLAANAEDDSVYSYTEITDDPDAEVSGS